MRTGARTALERLLKDAHTEPYARGDRLAVLADLRRHLRRPPPDHGRASPDLWAIGHTTTTAAVIQQGGTILADAPAPRP
ncbi:hypothetical protein ACFYPK_27915 [Streptomyces halstedii]|uniref:hypothetical protein n=1 Tax=Streptomyces halstedii TaxID=1944 RepID=UPI00345FE76D